MGASLLLVMAGCGGSGGNSSANKNTGGVVSATPAPVQTAPAASPTPEASPSPDMSATPTPAPRVVLTGAEALGDWTTDAPGVTRRITVSDLPAPFATDSANNGSQIVPRPDGAWPKAPDGFVVQQFADNLNNPRVITTAPNGDIFVAESGPNRVRVFRGIGPDGKAEQTQVFASGLNQPFGIAFYPSGASPRYVYVANTDSVVRFPYQNGDLTARGPAEVVVDTIPGGGKLPGGGHWTRDLAFSNDNKTLWVSVGSKSNIDEGNDPVERQRALIYAFSPDGTNGRIWASGLRNPVGLAVSPNGQLWTAVNERDGLGDHLVPDYITQVKEGGFYGWPWYYMGGLQDPRKQNEHPDLQAKTLLPDVLLQSHSASLDLCFYTGTNFPAEYQGDLFAASHGSWNRAHRTGYKVVRVPLQGGQSSGAYQDFLTGFVIDNQKVWGRPVGVTVANDGSLLVSDDGGNCIWRVLYAPGKAVRPAQTRK